MNTTKTEQKPETKSEVIYVRLTPRMKDAAERAAKIDRRPAVSDWVRVAIEEKLERDGGE